MHMYTKQSDITGKSWSAHGVNKCKLGSSL